MDWKWQKTNAIANHYHFLKAVQFLLAIIFFKYINKFLYFYINCVTLTFLFNLIISQETNNNMQTNNNNKKKKHPAIFICDIKSNINSNACKTFFHFFS